MYVVSVAQMRALEAAAFAAGTSEAALQERAGAALAAQVSSLLDPGELVVVLAGHGNNGRDGAVAARLLAAGGVRVHLLLAPRHAVRADEIDDLRQRAVRIADASDSEQLKASLHHATVAVDGLLGIGASGALREPLASFARDLNAARQSRGADLQVVSVDLPTGVDADSGAVPGEAVNADWTVTLGAVKQGLLRFPAAERVGTLVPAPIGIPEPSEPLPVRLLDDSVAALVPPRPLDAHKYRFGRVLVVAGSHQFLGAPVLCTAAAARSGAGVVTVAGPDLVRQAVVAHVPEATFLEHPFDLQDDPTSSVAALRDRLGTSVLALGPGLGRAPETLRAVRSILEQRAAAEHSPGAVVDADALVALAEWPRWWEAIGPGVAITPHAGELRRLVEAAGVEYPDTFEQVGQLARTWGVTLVAKGPFTAIGAPGGRVDVWPHANPALATGGTGDVLGGVCAGLMAQGLESPDAARLAVALHARCATAVTARHGWRTLLASDLVREIPAQMAALAGLQARRH